MSERRGKMHDACMVHYVELKPKWGRAVGTQIGTRLFGIARNQAVQRGLRPLENPYKMGLNGLSDTGRDVRNRMQ
jgi:hypothetical protein